MSFPLFKAYYLKTVEDGDAAGVAEVIPMNDADQVGYAYACAACPLASSFIQLMLGRAEVFRRTRGATQSGRPSRSVSGNFPKNNITKQN